MKLRRQEQQRSGGAPATTGGGSFPASELNRLRSEIDRLFEDPFSLLTPGTSFFEGWQPSVDVYEDRDKITIKAEVPGMRLEDINVAVHENTLTISGERKHEEEKKERERYRSERYFGRFQRSITLSSAVDADKIEARYRDGILTIECPKSEQAKPKQIQVKTS